MTRIIGIPDLPFQGDGVNLLATELARVCQKHLLIEKWLVAPNRRAGNQLLETITRTGQPVANVRVKTVRSMALDLAGPEMTRRGLKLLSYPGEEILAGVAWDRLKTRQKGYLTSLSPGPGLSRTILAAVKDLRLAGIDSGQVQPGQFETTAKGEEIILILKEYEQLLRDRKLIDYPGILTMIATGLENGSIILPEEVMIVVPAKLIDFFCLGLERDLIHSLEQNVIIIPEDLPNSVPDGKDVSSLSDAERLRWLSQPAQAPPPMMSWKDGTAEMFGAVGEANEVREVFRRCLESGLPLDDIEICCADEETYVPLIHEIASSLEIDRGGDGHGIPVTFAEGIPAVLTRPGRALTAWMRWAADDYPQKDLVDMIQDGFLKRGENDENRFSMTELAGLLRSAGIGFGRDRYHKILDRKIAAFQNRLNRPATDEDKNLPDDPKSLRRHLSGIRLVRDMVSSLLEITPQPANRPKDWIEKAARFLKTAVRAESEADNYARLALIGKVEELGRWITEGGNDPSFDAVRWLTDLPARTPIMGKGPRPGKIHVSSIKTGGHSGRRHTFIIGLDDSRFPGDGFQDPLLLDDERRNLSPNLPTSNELLDLNNHHLEHLLARIRGTVTLSFSCRDLLEDREMFPSPAAVKAFRIISRQVDGDQTAMSRWLEAPASLAPSRAAKCLTESEWWLWRLTGEEEVANRQVLVWKRFPHLSRGAQAAIHRESDKFTVYDGLIPSPDPDLDPASPAGPVMSASRLETIGRCPLNYFFKHVLAIEPPEELTLDPDRWLDPLQFGSLMHEVFYLFLTELASEGLSLSRETEGLLLEIIDRESEEYRRRYPPPSKEVYRRQRRELEDAARIFLSEEIRTAGNNQPVYLEASIGLPPTGDGTPMDSPDPVPYPLPDGRAIRLRGRIDRVDREKGESKNFFLWDYKSGSPGRYSRVKPFANGRIIQHAAYLTLAAARLKEVDPEGSVSRFGYFFPGRRGMGERFEWSPDQLAEGPEIIARLCRLAANGVFPATDDFKTDSCRFCDYVVICGDYEKSAAESKRKLDNPDNTPLEPFRELRRDND